MTSVATLIILACFAAFGTVIASVYRYIQTKRGVAFWRGKYRQQRQEFKERRNG